MLIFFCEQYIFDYIFVFFLFFDGHNYFVLHFVLIINISYIYMVKPDI